MGARQRRWTMTLRAMMVRLGILAGVSLACGWWSGEGEVQRLAGVRFAFPRIAKARWMGRTRASFGLVIRTGNGKGEIQGSLHCATHDKAVSSFGRDDVYFCLTERLFADVGGFE